MNKQRYSGILICAFIASILISNQTLNYAQAKPSSLSPTLNVTAQIDDINSKIVKHPSLSGRIAFMSQFDTVKGSFNNLYVMDADGNHIELLSTVRLAGELGVISSPQLSPRGRYIVYNQYPFHVKIVSMEKPTDVIDIPATMGAANASWSADGTEILFLSITERSIFRTSINQPDLQDKVVDESNTENLPVYPSLSPDGKYLVFIDAQPHGNPLILLNLQSAHLPVQSNDLSLKIISQDVNPGFCAWFSDSTHFIYIGSKGIFSVPVDGQSLPVTLVGIESGLGFENQPSGIALSPDNKNLLFNANENADSLQSIYLLDTDSSKISLMIKKANSPTWVNISK